MQVVVFHFLLLQDLEKNFLKAATSKKKKHNKFVMLARSKLNSIEDKISKSLINNEIIQIEEGKK